MTRIAESASVRFAGDDAGRRYLEKIAQVELTLPPPDPAAMRKVSSGFSASLRTGPRFVRDSPAPVAKRRRWIGWIERAKWWPLAVWTLLLFVLLGAAADDNGDAPAGIDAALYITFVVAVGLIFWSSRLRRRRRRQREAYEREIEDLKQKGELTPDTVAAKVTPEGAHDAERGLVEDLVSSSFLDSTEFRAVEQFMAGYPASLPRESKRMFNHAQLMTEIARAREMFGGSSKLQARDLARWIVLRARWPAVGQAVLRDPGFLAELEAAAESGDEDAGILGADDVEELIALLRESPPLSRVIERLIYFIPADPA
jgi:hypothetical protein